MQTIQETRKEASVLHHYVLWGDIQRIMSKKAEHKIPYGFYEAYTEAVQTLPRQSEELPYPDFEAWDCGDAQELFRLFLSIPVTYSTVGSQPVQTFFHQSLHTCFTFRQTFKIAPLIRQESMFYSSDCFSVFYVLDGEASLNVESDSYQISGGSVCIVPPKISHCFYGNETCVALELMVWEKKFTEVFSRVLSRRNILADYYEQFVKGKTTQTLHFFFHNQTRNFYLIRDLLSEHFCKKEYCEEICSSLIELFLIRAVREGAHLTQQNEDESSCYLYIPEVLHYIQKNCASVTLTKLSGVFGYSPGYLSKQLKKATGKSFQFLVSQARMEEAKYLLQNTELSLEEISVRLGYASAASFSNRFSKEMSVSPGLFRKK